MQVDLAGATRDRQRDTGRQEGRIPQRGERLLPRRAGQKKGHDGTVKVFYHGTRGQPGTRPWDGGVIWRGPQGHPGLATACQELGASVWWQTRTPRPDEPDSQRIALTVPIRSSGRERRLRGIERAGKGGLPTSGSSPAPINNYDVAASAADTRISRIPTKARTGTSHSTSGPSRPPRSGSSPVAAGEADARMLRRTGSVPTPWTETATSSSTPPSACAQGDA